MQDWIRAVVHVAVTQVRSDYDSPWQSNTSTTAGCAVAIGPGRLLCAANLVADAISIRIQRPDRSGTAAVRVEAINHDCDLALLVLAQPTTLLDDIVPVALGSGLPDYAEDVSLVNCEADGATVFAGEVAAIEIQRYAHSQRHLLTLAVDSPSLTDGSGPAFVAGTLVGIASQRRNDDKLVECVPVPLIRTFLEAVDHGRAQATPALGFMTQNLENPTLRAHYGLRADQTGVVVLAIDHGGSADGVLQRDDIVTAIAGRPISNTATVDYEGYALRFDVVLGERFVGDTLALDIVRAGRPMSVSMQLRPWRPLVARSTYDQPCRYFLYGGLVFQPLTRDYLTTWNEWWNGAPKEFLNYYYLGLPTAAQREIVVLTRVLEDDVNRGYKHLYNEGIASVDGRVPVDFQQFVSQLRDARGTVRIETTSGGIIVLDVDEVQRAAPALLARYEIPVTN